MSSYFLVDFFEIDASKYDDVLQIRAVQENEHRNKDHDLSYTHSPIPRS